MKKLKQFPEARRNPNAKRVKKNQLIDQLIAEGHVPMSVDSAVLAIEQCEAGDSFPKGWCEEPLKVSVYPDPDIAGQDRPDELFIHAGRAGVMEVYLTVGAGKTYRMVPLPMEHADPATKSFSNLARVDAIAQLVQKGLTGSYSVLHPGTLESAGIRQDATLAALGEKVESALRNYRAHLETLPGVLEKWQSENA